MATDIHPTAVVDPKAEIADGVQVGPCSVIGPDVKIGAGTRILNLVTLMGNTTIGENCQIFPGSVVGGPPQDLKYKGGPSYLSIGDSTIIRECCTINTGTELGGGKTVVGNNNVLLAYVHIAHDCILSDRVVISNASQLAGHVHVHEGARIMGLAGLHQFVRVGRLGVVAGCARVSVDVPPYSLAAGHPAKIHGLNLEGLKRRSVAEEDVVALKKAFRMVFLRDGTRIDAYRAIADEGLDQYTVVKEFIESLRETDKGRHGRALEGDRVDLPPEERDGKMGYMLGPGESGMRRIDSESRDPGSS